ncbi:hypothetical protein BDR26DRAFT_916688 [Obelidium mucronatum]|nr:hypothetical protein BDR26DRAFT_916688 [Obelidium mucronatum]
MMRALVLLLLAAAAQTHRTDADADGADSPPDAAALLLLSKAPPSSFEFPAAPRFAGVVAPLAAAVDAKAIAPWLTRLTLFPERYYRSQNGAAAAHWIADQVRALPVPKGTKLTVSFFNHTDFIQPSVLVRYENPFVKNLTGTVIAGTHMDTLAQRHPLGQGGPNPGADDCASGSASLFEALRVLTTNNWVPGRAIEFHWYAAEEISARGSKEIANMYANKSIPVVAYLNVDQTGYVMPGTRPEVGIFSDYTTENATNFLSLIVEAYTGLPQVKNQRCGQECSDHVGWFRAGYESAFAFEGARKNGFPDIDVVNPDGSPLDTLEFINMTHVAVFAKNTIGFVVELSLAGTYNGTVPTSAASSRSSSNLLFGLLLQTTAGSFVCLFWVLGISLMLV